MGEINLERFTVFYSTKPLKLALLGALSSQYRKFEDNEKP